MTAALDANVGGPLLAREVVDRFDVAPPATGRPWTPDEPLPNGGVRIRVKRCCNGCSIPIGDATDEEVEAALFGEPLPDVRGECPTCTGPRETPC